MASCRRYCADTAPYTRGKAGGTPTSPTSEQATASTPIVRAPTESGATPRRSTRQSRPPKRGKAKQKLKVAQGIAELGAGQGQKGPSVPQGDAELGAGQGDAERGAIPRGYRTWGTGLHS